MRTFATLLACPLAALGAAIAPREGSVPTGPWTAGVWRMPQDSDVFFAGDAINASGGKFWVNKDTSAYCPEGIEGLDCSAYPGSQTVFDGGNQTLSLSVAVPGGQQGTHHSGLYVLSMKILLITTFIVYIDEDGSLSYTQPHSGAMPNGSIATGFGRQQSESFGAPVNLYNDVVQGWIICPTSEGEPRERTYQLFAGGQKDGCYATDIRTYTADGYNAWEYI